MMEQSVIAIVVTYKRSAYLHACLSSLLNQRPIQHIVVVDNNSTEDREFNSIEGKFGTESAASSAFNHFDWNGASIIQTAQAPIYYIPSPRNGGGAGGFKLGTDFATQFLPGKYLFLIDDDAEPQESCVANLVEQIETLGSSFCCPVVFNHHIEDYEFGQHKKEIDFRTLSEKNVLRQDLAAAYVPLVANGFVGFLCEKEKLKAVGGVPEQFFLLYDDTDTAYRLYTRFGTGHLITTARVVHKYRPGTSLPFWRIVLEARNRILFVKRNHASKWFVLRHTIAGVLRCWRQPYSLRARSRATRTLLATAFIHEAPFELGRY